MPKLQIRPELHKNNTSGVVGVSRVVSRGVPYWLATYRDPITKEPKNKYFNINRLGEEPAKQLAVEYRAFAIEWHESQRSIKHGQDRDPQQTSPQGV